MAMDVKALIMLECWDVVSTVLSIVGESFWGMECRERMC